MAESSNPKRPRRQTKLPDSDITTAPYDPLNYANLARSCVLELLEQPIEALLLERTFNGAGVYALFYVGDFEPYRAYRIDDVASSGRPIYVGKADPKGGRTGYEKGAVSQKRELYDRIREHGRSLNAVENLRLADFYCRYLVVEPLWIRIVERFLIEDFRPPWNGCLGGFGIHNPGGNRPQEISWWDAMHPDRPQALKWKVPLKYTRDHDDAKRRLRAWLARPLEQRQVTVDDDPSSKNDGGD